MVRLPEATEQIRFAPVRALRAVFSGVGQLLLAADRLREEDAEQAAEARDDQHDPLASWDGRLSSSVRLIPPAGAPDSSPAPAEAQPAPAKAAAPTPAKAKPAGTEPAGTQPTGTKPTGAKPTGAKPTGAKPTGAKPASAKKPKQAAPARASRAGQAAASSGSKTAKPSTRTKKSSADGKRAKATSASGGSASSRSGSGRKSGRSKAVAEPSRFRSLDLTGNVRMLSNADIADMTVDEFERNTAARPTPPTAQSHLTGVIEDAATPPWSQAAPSWSSWSTNADVPQPDLAPAEDAPQASDETPPDPAPTAEDSPPPAADLPIAGYDELSLPSLRARLRQFDADDLAVLLAHERSHANREDIVTMFERRIARLAEADQDRPVAPN